MDISSINRNSQISYNLIQSLGLTFFVCILAAERAALSNATNDYITAFTHIILQDTSVLAILLGSWVFYLLFFPRAFIGKHSKSLNLYFYVALYLYAFIDQQFFIKTGSSLDWGLVQYSFLHFYELSGVLSSGINFLAISNFIIAIIIFSVIHLKFYSRTINYEYHEKPALRIMLPAFIFLTSYHLAEAGNGSYLPGVYQGIATGFDQNNVFISYTGKSIDNIDVIYKHPVINSAGNKQSKPNIVLIVLESTGSQALAFTSSDRKNKAKVPFLAKIAKEGILIENTYTTVSHTSKALVGILCGMYPRLVMDIEEAEPLNLKLTCLPHILQNQNYRTAFFQAAPGTFENRKSLLRNFGFENWITQESLDHTKYKKAGYFGLDEYAMLQPAKEWLKQDSEAPFFATFLTILSHHPYELPDQDFSKLSELEKYKRTLEYTDKYISEIYKIFEKLDLLNNTLFIITGDHGEAFGNHNIYQHDVVPYNEVTQVPIILSGTQLNSNIDVKGLRSHLDIMPTILDILDLEWSGKLPGKTLFEENGHDYVISSCWYNNHCLSMRQDSFKYIYRYYHRPMEIYDIESDPEETINLANNYSKDDLEKIVNQMISLQFAVKKHYELN